MRPSLAPAVLFLLLTTSPAGAQTPEQDLRPPLNEGDRVRVVYCEPDCDRARLTVTSRLLRFDSEAGVLVLDPASRLHLVLSRDRHQAVLRPAMVRDTVYVLNTPAGMASIPLRPGWRHTADRLEVPLERTHRVHVRGPRSRDEGALWGAAIGGVAGAIIAVPALLNPVDCVDCIGPVDTIQNVVAAGVLLLAPAVGAAVGVLIPGRKWHRVGTEPLREAESEEVRSAPVPR